MSKNVIVNGTTYNGVNSVKLAQDGGGYATFTDASGSSAQSTELYSLTVSDAQRIFPINWNSDWNVYGAFVITFENILLTANDWLRLQYNGTGTTGTGFYVNGTTKFTDLASNTSFLLIKHNDKFYWANGNSTLTEITPTVINVLAVGSDTSIASGTIKIYGIK